MAGVRASIVQQEREEVYAALQKTASFHCLVEEWKDCEELKPKPKEKWTFVNRHKEAQKHQTEWCTGGTPKWREGGRSLSLKVVSLG